MRKFIRRLYQTTRRFTIADFAIFKITLVLIGILLGFYLRDVFGTVIIAIWILAVIAYILLMIKVIRYYRKEQDLYTKTVPEVDIQRYMGRWYEIASYPQWFEKGLTCVSARYTLKEEYVEVFNSGYKNGKLKEAHGIARVVEGSGGAKLKVSFFRPFYGKYWIVDLAEDYLWVVVSNPNRSTLWILCRTQTMDADLYQTILAKLKANGFDTSKLVIMKQDEFTHHSA